MIDDKVVVVQAASLQRGNAGKLPTLRVAFMGLEGLDDIGFADLVIPVTANALTGLCG